MNGQCVSPDEGIYGIRASWVAPVAQGASEVLIEDGLVLIKASKIVSVSQYSESTLDPSIPIIHLEGQLITPGFVNCHTHSGMALLRGVADDMSLHEWLTNAIWPIEAEFVTPDYVRLGTKLAVYEYLKTGTTTFVDQYFHCDESISVCEKVGIRIACGEPVLDKQDGRIYDKVRDSCERVSIIRKNHDPDYVFPILNPHACYTVPEDALKMIGDFAKESSYRVNTHLHESQHECDHYADTHEGKTAFQTLIDAGLFNSNLIAAHCVCLSESEQQLLVAHKVNVVHCPKSNMKLASGICPVQSLINAGVNVALGTDSACSNNGLSMILEMQAASLVGKTIRCKKGVPVNGGDPTAVSCYTALRMATYNGAKALGLLDKIGSIEPGKLADLVAIDLTAPECHPIYDPISTLVYSSGAKVSNVWIGGRRLFTEGKVTAALDLDMEEVRLTGKQISSFQKKYMYNRLKFDPKHST
jgi:5-methylthioadenosine/S-adenosylhomocysteine deaminase